jgi:dipeptidyl aminopeptidase/acylaminoacyl peptidase
MSSVVMFIVFKIDLRGHGNSEGIASGAYYSADYVIDVLNAYESLKKLKNVDPKRVSLWGHSMAGNIVFRSIVIHPEIPKAVIWSGAVYTYKDMEEYGIQDGSYRPSQNTNPNRRQKLRDAVGPVSSASAFWNNFIPTNFTSTITTKIQIHHAVNDPVVSIEYSRNLKEELAKKGVSVELFEYPTGGHNIESPSFNLAIQRSADFIRN